MGTRRVLPEHVKKFMVEFLKANPEATYSEYRAAAKVSNQVDFVVDSTFSRWRGDKTKTRTRRGRADAPVALPAATDAVPAKREYRRSGNLYFKVWQTTAIDQFDLLSDMLESIMRTSKEKFEIIELSNPKLIEVRGMVK